MSIPFFLVWREDGGATGCQQPDQEQAVTEAARVARCNPGTRIYVLAPVESFKVVAIEREQFIDTSELVPF